MLSTNSNEKPQLSSGFYFMRYHFAAVDLFSFRSVAGFVVVVAAYSAAVADVVVEGHVAAAEDAAVVAVDRVEDRLRPLSESVVLPPWLLLPQPSGAWWLRSIDSLILLLLLCLNYSFFELDFGMVVKWT